MLLVVTGPAPHRGVFLEIEQTVARDAIAEVKRESRQAQRALDQRRQQAKEEIRRVADKHHRKTTRGMKKNAANYDAKRSRANLIVAIAALVTIGVAVLVGTQEF